MSFFEKQKASNWIFRSFRITPEGQGLYRIFVALFILSFLLPDTGMYEFAGTLPDDFYTPPPGPMWLFNGFPSVLVFHLLHGILVFSLLCLLTGFKTLYASIGTGVILLIIKGFFYSVGKINHDLLIAVVPVLMSFSSWGAAYSIDSYTGTSGKKVHSWPLTLLALIIGFMMFTAGFPKLLGGWLFIDSQATLGHFFNQYYVKNRQDLLAELLIHFDNRVIWELFDYGTVFFEMGFLVAILRPVTTRLFVSFAIIFHFSIMMILNISFLPNFIAYAAFLDWTAIDNKLKEWLPVKFGSVYLLTSGFGILLLIIFLGRRLGIPDLHSDLTMPEFYILVLALGVSLSYIGQLFISKFSRSQRLAD